MARYAVKTELSPEETIDEVVRFFEGAIGLTLEERSECCVYLTGGGGHVSVTATDTEGDTTAEIETREWDTQVREFMRRIG